MKLKNRVALITGAGNGIGKEIALLFAKEGANLIIVDIDGYGAEATSAEILNNGGTVEFIHTNVANAKECVDLLTEIQQHHHNIDILINNAGILHHKDGDPITTDEIVA